MQTEIGLCPSAEIKSQESSTADPFAKENCHPRLRILGDELSVAAELIGDIWSPKHHYGYKAI